MCLAIPGKLTEINGEQTVFRSGKVDFGGVTREVNLAYVPEAETGNWVLVHVGFALSVIDEEEAQKVLLELEALKEIDGGMLPADEDL